jgi:hypothetical protein
LSAIGDMRDVMPDEQASYFGVIVDDSSLTTGASAQVGATRLDTWLATQ